MLVKVQRRDLEGLYVEMLVAAVVKADAPDTPASLRGNS